MKSTVLASALVLPLVMVSCDSTPARPNPYSTTMVQRGPVTAYPDVEVFGENPLSAFQRTGSQPMPIANLPVGTALQVIAKSGAFYQVTLPDARTGWVAARSISGVTAPVPDFSESAPVTPGTGAGDPHGLPGGNTQPDTIDLDRMP